MFTTQGMVQQPSERASCLKIRLACLERVNPPAGPGPTLPHGWVSDPESSAQLLESYRFPEQPRPANKELASRGRARVGIFRVSIKGYEKHDWFVSW